MHITAEPRDHYTVLHLRGEFDTFYCRYLESEIEQLIAAGSVHVALNLRLVKFINSTALGQIIKTGKALSSRGGKLVLLRPSNFCRDIIEKVGIDRVVPIFMSDEEAAAALAKSASAPARGAPAQESADDESSVLFNPIDEARIDHFISEELRKGPAIPFQKSAAKGGWVGIGRMASVDHNGLRFTWTGGNTGLTPFEMAQFLAIGTELKLRFSLPMLKKGMLEAVATINEVEERADGVKVGTAYKRIDDEHKKALKQYADDLAFLKSELKKETRH